MSDQPTKPKLVPRFKEAYAPEALNGRLKFLSAETGAVLKHVRETSQDAAQWRGNIENPIGVAQMPLGVAGPIQVNGEHAQGRFYVPLATTEGALVRSYERGMVTLTRCGGVDVRLQGKGNEMAPCFFFDTVTAAHAFANAVPQHLEQLAAACDTTTKHGILTNVLPKVTGRTVQLIFRYQTGDAQGMNMICKATEACCRYLQEAGLAGEYHIFSGLSGEKHTSGYLLNAGKGRQAVAGASIPARWCRAYLHVEPQQMVDLWSQTMVGQVRAGTLGYHGHLANGLTALFIATGQDVANVVNASLGMTRFEMTRNGDLYASLTLSALTVATVGGGVSLGTSQECLHLMGCYGSGKAGKFAEIITATLLAGELSFAAAIAGGEFVDAHEQYGRNRPQEDP